MKSNYDTHVYAHKSLPSDLLMQYGKLRYHSFSKDDPHVNLDHERKTEFDRFDDGLSNPIYIMITTDDTENSKPRLVCAMRFIGCDSEYDLEHESWSYITKGVTLPKDPAICETTRWVGQSSRTIEGMITSGLMNIATYKLAQEKGWTKTLGAPAHAGAEWMRSRGINVEQFGKPYESERDGFTIQLALVDLEEDYLKMGNDMLIEGIRLDLINRISIENLAA